ncbi:MAG: tRNA-uridine aminocarboxypropyltransferase [Kiritimatiellia bacterium]|nr:tRNA-uridine aminocarboxypropyltransferase [Kiritimatiellia bacterium]
MRASRLRDYNSRCSRCYLRREICICPILPTVQTRAEFLILRHIGEAGRPSNTGRLVALTLPNSRIVPCGGGERIGISSPDDELLRASGTWLLWPDGTTPRTDMPELTPPERVVVLDATWQQARRLYATVPALRAMPQLVLPSPHRDRNRLRDQHRPDGMSTIEAVAAAVARLEGASVAEPLERLYDEVVRRRTAMRWGFKPV